MKPVARHQLPLGDSSASLSKLSHSLKPISLFCNHTLNARLSPSHSPLPPFWCRPTFIRTVCMCPVEEGTKDRGVTLGGCEVEGV
jgi:hypothetical protein